jgi:hypothetical protein
MMLRNRDQLGMLCWLVIDGEWSEVGDDGENLTRRGRRGVEERLAIVEWTKEAKSRLRTHAQRKELVAPNLKISKPAVLY